MNARVTLIGIEQMLNFNEKSFTDAWECEYGDFDKDTLLSAIITTGGRFEPIYTDPDYFRMMCGHWWNKWQSTIDKWFDAFSQEYNPLWDRNGFETVHEDTYDVGTNDTTTETNEVVDDDTTAHTTNNVSAYDQTTYQPHDESISSGTDDRTTDFTGSVDNDTTNDRDFDREYHSFGNWGISQTSQKLLEQEFNIRRINLYNQIADLFVNEMCVRVW